MLQEITKSVGRRPGKGIKYSNDGKQIVIRIGVDLIESAKLSNKDRVAVSFDPEVGEIRLSKLPKGREKRGFTLIRGKRAKSLRLVISQESVVDILPDTCEAAAKLTKDGIVITLKEPAGKEESE